MRNNRAPCVASTAVGTEGEEDQMARSSASAVNRMGQKKSEVVQCFH